MKILILKPSSLGDVIHALPVLRMIKKAWPTADIYWWLAKELFPLLENDPDLSGLYAFDRKRWVYPVHWGEFFGGVAQLRQKRFDYVLDLQALARSGFVAWLANGDCTIGLDDRREGAAGFYDYCVPRPSYHTHAVDWYLRVLEPLGVPLDWNFVWLPENKIILESFNKRWPEARQPFILINPGARWFNKRWPVEYFGELTRQLARAYPSSSIGLLGSWDERHLAEAIAASAPGRCWNLAGQTSLPELVEWIRRCQLLVTNDTGPMHIAAALGRPLTALFGPTTPSRTGPYFQLEKVLQAPLPCAPCMKSRCHHQPTLECLTKLTPDLVFHQIHGRLSLPSSAL